MIHRRCPTKGRYLKDLETGNIQHTDEVLPLILGIQGPVDTGYQPAEHLRVHSLGQGSHGVHHLVLVLTLGYVLVTDLYLWLQQGLQQIAGIHTEKEGNLFSLCGSENTRNTFSNRLYE